MGEPGGTLAYPTFVSFCTDDQLYRDHLAELEISARRQDLVIHALQTDIKFASWQRAAAYKREVISYHWTTLPGPIVWVDADARFRSYPELFDTLAEKGVDFAARWRQGGELLSGTLYFGDTVAAGRLLELWAEVERQSPDEWDQRTLAIALDMLKQERTVVVHELPPAYCYIFDRDKKQSPGVEPVIEHLQASRKARKSS